MNPVFSDAELRGIYDQALRNVPDEKAKGILERAKIARILQNAGSVRVPGLGQKIGTVDARTFMRHHQERPRCWDDKEYREEFLRDNPECRAAGYRPKSRKQILTSTKFG